MSSCYNPSGRHRFHRRNSYRAAADSACWRSFLKPRNTLTGTRAEPQLQRTFWAAYVRSYLTGGKEESIGDATAVFTIDTLAGLRLLLTPQALATPVVFTKRFTDAVFAACLGLRSGEQIIAVNARFKADPEMVAHTLVEEFVHAQQS